ncbi:hypothetical protein EK21DRAFT_117855 [Setomelanomma holmii]|uniref:Uncharacterized protein n=1 Tax=Setomelanomma holmii TaxID=210430 RepID=A0A9P4LGM3_9PLEO|nr:hypothetical protein EK21DRAFT_117855 [Setomelanomma holmii]
MSGNTLELRTALYSFVQLQDYLWTKKKVEHDIELEDALVDQEIVDVRANVAEIELDHLRAKLEERDMELDILASILRLLFQLPLDYSSSYRSTVLPQIALLSFHFSTILPAIILLFFQSSFRRPLLSSPPQELEEQDMGFDILNSEV